MTSPSIIKTFARIHPDRACPDYIIDTKNISLLIPDPFNSHLRQSVSHRFPFDQVFTGDSSQEQVFDVAAREVVAGFLSGYNATIFAYGQTGSGKTHTMHGNASRYKNRGIAPRALSMIYSNLELRDEDFSIRVSYLEIYQEVGYDLLCAPSGRNGSLIVPQFPKVGVFEGGDGGCVVRNLSNHLAANEDVAQTLLLQGESNRRIAETPLNARSSRSHAVFTITLTSRKPDSDVIVKSKLHLVDLAGSERCAKTGVEGAQLIEAKCINLSLHHLEGVIIGLQNDAGHKNIGPWAKSKIHSFLRPYDVNTKRLKRPHTSGGRIPNYSSNSSRHIPYRNSLLTMLLKDSLGGNCLTAMIATINMAPVNIGETISTCRFAQRVACIKNMAKKNEEVDDKSLIKQLRKQVEKLEAEMMLLRNGELLAGEAESLTHGERQLCETLMRRYVGGTVSDPVREGVTSLGKFRLCLHILKTMITEHVCSLENEDNGIIPHHMMTSSKLSHVETSRPNDVRGLRQTRSRNSLTTSSTVDILTLDDVRPESAASTLTLTSRDLDAMTSEVTSSKPSLAATEMTVTETPTPPPPPKMTETPRTSRIASAPARGRKLSDDVIKKNDDVVTRPISAEPKRGAKSPNKLTGSVSSGSTKSLEQAVNHANQKDRYRSPYEKRQEREAQKLHERVEKLTHESATIGNDIEARKQQIRQEQLLVLKRDLEHKLDVSRQQLTDQNSLIGRLMSEQAESDVLLNEQLVKRNLKYRITKIEKRLRAVEQKMKRPSSGATSTTLVDPKTTIGEKFPRFVKQDGGLYANNLIDLLHAEEKIKKKQQMKLVNKRITTMAMELEVKEMATRQRLREFKEKLRLFRETKILSQQNGEQNDETNDYSMNRIGSDTLQNCEPRDDDTRAPGGNNRGQSDPSATIGGDPFIAQFQRSTTYHENKHMMFSPPSQSGESNSGRGDPRYKMAWGTDAPRDAPRTSGVTAGSAFRDGEKCPSVNQAEKPFETDVTRPITVKKEAFGQANFKASASGEPTIIGSISGKTPLGKGYSSALTDGYLTDDGYAQFQRPKFEKMTKRTESDISSGFAGSAKMIPDVNLTGIPIRSDPFTGNPNSQNQDIEAFIKKLQGLKLEQAFTRTPNPEFSRLEFDAANTVELPRRESFQEKRLSESSKKLFRNLSLTKSKDNVDGPLVDGRTDFRGGRENSSSHVDGPRPATSPSTKPVHVSSKKTKNHHEKLAVNDSNANDPHNFGSMAANDVNDVAATRRHSKSEFKIDWEKGLIHINAGRSTESVDKSRIRRHKVRPRTSDGRVRSEFKLNVSRVDSTDDKKERESKRPTVKAENQNHDGGSRALPSQSSPADEGPEGRNPLERVEVKQEANFLKLAREQKERVRRLRKAQSSAEIIQRAWKKYKARLRRHAVEM